MRSHQEANDSVSIEQEQADQVRRTVGATLAARALEEVLPAIGKGYAPQAHRKAAERMSKDMDKPGFTFTVDRYEEDDTGDGQRIIVNSTTGDMEAASNLIEAAPDLHDAVAKMRAFVAAHANTLVHPEFGSTGVDNMLAVADAALSAARGEGRVS